MTIKTYEPGKSVGIMAPHEVRDWCKVRRILRAALKGATIPAIVTEGEIAFNGTHRLAALDLAEMLGLEISIDIIDFRETEAYENEETRELLIEAIEQNDGRTLQELLDD